MKFIKTKDLNKPCRIAIVVSRFNQGITQMLYEGALARMRELDLYHGSACAVWVPGAVEIPVTAQRLAKTGQYDVIVALGAVIRGETSHYDYVCSMVSEGCQAVALKHDIPVIFGVLTTENTAQAKDRLGGSKGHKGRDAIDAAYEMVSVLGQLPQLP